MSSPLAATTPESVALAKALKDRDWEVVATAAAGLGDVGGKRELSPLVKLAWDGPIDAIRRASARSASRCTGSPR